MRIGILTANLGSFDEDVPSVEQKLPNYAVIDRFHRWTDENFPPIAGLTPRFQYRMPKLFGWQMLSNYDYFDENDVYIWLDGSVSFQRDDCVRWLTERLSEYDIAFLKHPERDTIKSEVSYIDKRLKEGDKYLTDRYKNGRHNECYAEIMKDKNFVDNTLLASTAFIYRNNKRVHDMMKDWWFLQSKFYSCDQIPLPYVLWKNKVRVKIINENIYNCKYLTFKKHK
jgi:hypothetical protein